MADAELERMIPELLGTNTLQPDARQTVLEMWALARRGQLADSDRSHIIALHRKAVVGLIDLDLEAEEDPRVASAHVAKQAEIQRLNEKAEREWKNPNLTKGQLYIVGLADLASSVVTACSFGLFVPNWGQDALQRLRRNQAILAERRMK